MMRRRTQNSIIKIVLSLVVVVLLVSVSAVAFAAEAERPYIGDNTPLTQAERREAHIASAIASIVIALAVSLIITAVWTSQLKSVKPRDSASDYMRRGSFNLRVQRDIFLYRNVRRMPRTQNNSSRRR